MILLTFSAKHKKGTNEGGLVFDLHEHPVSLERVQVRTQKTALCKLLKQPEALFLTPGEQGANKNKHRLSFSHPKATGLRGGFGG